MDYGLQIEPAYGFEYDQAAELVNSATRHGYTSAWSSDHFMLNPVDTDRDCMDCWTFLAGLARDTSGLRIGSLVTCVTYRNPAVLAKVAATVDRMSGGRLVFGIGAGWNEAEHNAYGIPFPPVGERVERLREGVELIRKLWTEPVTNFDGQHYSASKAVSAPKPLQDPHPPILIGGSKPRVLRTVARYANYTNMGSGQSPESYEKNLGVLNNLCKEEGTNFDHIRRSHLMTFVTGRDSTEVDTAAGSAAKFAGVSKKHFIENRGFTFIGTTSEAVDAIKKYRDAGVQEMVTRFPFGDEERSMQLMADEVMAKV